MILVKDCMVQLVGKSKKIVLSPHPNLVLYLYDTTESDYTMHFSQGLSYTRTKNVATIGFWLAGVTQLPQPFMGSFYTC